MYNFINVVCSIIILLFFALLQVFVYYSEGFVDDSLLCLIFCLNLFKQFLLSGSFLGEGCDFFLNKRLLLICGSDGIVQLSTQTGNLLFEIENVMI